ncbi:fumarylacetoacetate hydrolase family protein [Sphingomonas oryzagri]|uniref:Fumarylacetoacetate hydrolase family protein n=1 Tax=Sphingomonas oryzagri TaxID=3042314 RepID=A0ABT6N343_9SPHN|nr:fumarylacetoacetate hydrolase family protein [Sphingomonas oryzagri]MDH7639497.1 fumarylacetoacetate hydrolase family protein [Sphingomonas oryzagri]
MDVPTLTQPSIEIVGEAARFPVRRIFCVGRNYAEHAREMGHDPDAEPPFFFTKPADAAVAGGVLPFPSRTEDLHHEVELVVALGKGGANVDKADALGLVFGSAVGLDLTRRDMQAVAKKLARPWDMAKGFDASAPLAPLTRGLPAPDAAITLTIDGDLRQQGRLTDLIWPIDALIAELSTYVALEAGDLIFTGTPSGVGPIHRGETVIGTIEGLPSIEVRFE